MNATRDRLVRAKVLLELGWVPEAELETARVLDDAPDDLTAISLFAKIKHVRGQLSQAIGCWAHIHARSPHNENALMLLRSMLELARDPERAASEYLVLGGLHLTRKPAVQLELEHAFALFHERKPDEARAWCAHVAARHHGSDAQLYKLAIMAGAWVAELAGELAEARVLLENLGHERGFELDLDRLFALVRVYDRIATPETTDAAIMICRHVLRDLGERGVEKISLFRQLASLERRAGRVASAAELDRAFLAGVRRRMHRPSLDELVAVAAREYVPLTALRAARPAGDEAPLAGSRREQALVHALRGDHAQARALLADGSDPLDRRYLAELVAHDGDEGRAIAIYLDTLGDFDPHAVGWLLDRQAPAIDAWLAANREAIVALLEQECVVAPQRPDPWRRLARAHESAAEGERCRVRADALARAAAARAHPIGRVLAASVYHFTGKAKGLLHEIWVHREPAPAGRGGTLAADDILGNITPEMRAAIRNTFVAVREYARARFPLATADLADYTYSYKLPKEDEPSGGMSAGLPSALAFMSMFLQRPVPHGIASSGALVTESHDSITIGRIGEVDYKVKAAYHANARALILPAANRVDLERSTLVPAELASEIVQYATDLDQAMGLVFGPGII